MPAIAWWHLLLLAMLAAVLFGAQVGGSWRYDDPLILQYVQNLPNYHAPFTSPAAWRELGAPFFTPMLTLVFQVAHTLFGVWTAGHYVLHLLAMLAAAALTYALIAPRVGATAALGATALFLLGAPTAVVAAQLMDTHYVWGLVLALLATLAWRRFTTQNSSGGNRRAWGWAAASAVLYLLAVLSKEIFAPLPLLLWVLWVLAGKRRWRWTGLLGLAGHAAVALLYLPWRRTMLGSTTGGYGGAQTGWDSLTASVPALAQAFWGQGWPAWAAILCALVLTVKALCGQGRVGWGLLASALFALLLPYGFVTASADPTHLRLAFLPWWAVCVLMACALRPPQPTGARGAAGPGALRHTPYAAAWPWAAFALLAGATLLAQQRTQAQLAVETRVYDAYARHAMAPPGATWAILQGRAATDPHFQYGLARMAQRQGLTPSTVQAFPAQARHASLGTPGLTGYAYSDDCRCMAALPAPHTEVGGQHTAPSNAAGTIQLQMQAPPPRGLRWHFAPTPPGEGGDWYLQVPRLNITMQFPASGAIYFSTPPWLLREEFRVIWRGNNGIWTQTPPLAFPAQGETIQF